MGGWAPSSWRAPGRWCRRPAPRMTGYGAHSLEPPAWAQIPSYPDSPAPDPKSLTVATLLHQKGGGTSQDPSADLSSRTSCSGVQGWGLNSRQTDQSVHRPCPAGLRLYPHPERSFLKSSRKGTFDEEPAETTVLPQSRATRSHPGGRGPGMAWPCILGDEREPGEGQASQRMARKESV